MAKITFYNDFTRVWNVDGSLLGAVVRLINIYKEKPAILHGWQQRNRKLITEIQIHCVFFNSVRLGVVPLYEELKKVVYRDCQLSKKNNTWIACYLPEKYKAD